MEQQRVQPDAKRGSEGRELSQLYGRRFTEPELAFKAKAWEILCEEVFQQYVNPEDTVLDLGAGRCEFINAIRCRAKIAVDLNPDVATYAREARVVVAPSTDFGEVESASVDLVFSSNLLEHLPSKTAVLDTLRQCARVLCPGGTLIVLMPNIRYLPGRYWDYFDHHTPMTHLSLVEALGLSGFSARRVVPRFLPYTVKDRRIPQVVLLLRAYLRLPPLWPMFGRQMLVVAERAG